METHKSKGPAFPHSLIPCQPPAPARYPRDARRDLIFSLNHHHDHRPPSALSLCKFLPRRRTLHRQQSHLDPTHNGHVWQPGRQPVVSQDGVGRLVPLLDFSHGRHRHPMLMLIEAEAHKDDPKGHGRHQCISQAAWMPSLDPSLRLLETAYQSLARHSNNMAGCTTKEPLACFPATLSGSSASSWSTSASDPWHRCWHWSLSLSLEDSDVCAPLDLQTPSLYGHCANPQTRSVLRACHVSTLSKQQWGTHRYQAAQNPLLSCKLKFPN
ncbi:hypothetical protein BKA80DRAFT_68999 [Phyllosticta citrichinensis]